MTPSFLNLSRMRQMRLLPILLLILLSSVSSHAQQNEGVPPERLARLQGGGIGLSHWLWGFLDGEDVRTAFETRITAGDMALIRGMGFQHVRLPVDIALIYDWNKRGNLLPNNLDYLDRAIQMAHSHDLAVIVAPFGTAYTDRVTDAAQFNRVMEFWEVYADYLSQYDPDMTFIQIANEPVTEAAEWAHNQARLVPALRELLPEYTFITATPLLADGTWSIVGALLEMPLLDDPNVVYGFHFYEPIPFTYFRAEWIDWGEGIHPNTFDRDYVRDKLAQVVGWAETHQVPIVVDEFGVYWQQGVSPTERLAWLCMVRSTFTANQFGWTVWDYNGGFGITQVSGTRRSIDLAEMQALGLIPGGCPVDPDAPPVKATPVSQPGS
jgi:endoglucanase